MKCETSPGMVDGSERRHWPDNVPKWARGYEGFGGRVGRSVADSASWWPPEVRAPEGAPNVVVVLIDDMGYSDFGPFGGEVETPTVDLLAANGLRLSNYHTTPVCSPARAALLTGLNPHRAGFASVANADFGFPGFAVELAEDVVTLPEVLRANGYATFAVGKWHLTRDGAMHDAASRSSWPVQRGFDRYYGSLEGMNSFFAPNRLIRDNSPVEVDRYPDDYYLTDDLTDEAIGMIRSLRAHDLDKPFFLYLAHYAMHVPLGAKPADLEKYRGRYDAGWDVLREERFARQLASGLFPPGTRMAPRNRESGYDVPAWEEVPAEQRKLLSRFMEVYAAMVDNIDQNLARLLAAIDDYGQLDNTIVILTSDNGGTSGAPNGMWNFLSIGSEYLFLSHSSSSPPVPGHWDVPRDDPELIGGPRTMVANPRGWGMATNTPFRLYKGSTFAGGVRVPFIISWPRGLQRSEGDPGLRDQYVYVTDIFPSLTSATGVEVPPVRHGRVVQSVDGHDAIPFLRDREHPATHYEQYAEYGGQRGFYRNGWKLLTLHRKGAEYDEGEWQLFNVHNDPTEIDDLSQQEPERTAELAAAWEKAAWENTVFPLSDDTVLFFALSRPADERLQEPLRLYPGTPTLERYRASQLIGLRSFDIEIDLDYAHGDEGVLVAHGDQGGGYIVYLEDGLLHLDYNEYGRLHEVTSGALIPGPHLVRLSAHVIDDFRWGLSVSVDEQVRATLPDVAMLHWVAPFTGIDVGIDRGGPVSWPMHERHGSFRYSGTLNHVTYLPGKPADYDPRSAIRAALLTAAIYD